MTGRPGPGLGGSGRHWSRSRCRWGGRLLSSLLHQSRAVNLRSQRPGLETRETLSWGLLPGHSGLVVEPSPPLCLGGSCASLTVYFLKVAVIFEQGTPRFGFAQGPVNYVMSPMLSLRERKERNSGYVQPGQRQRGMCPQSPRALLLFAGLAERMKQETKLHVIHLFISYPYFRDEFCIR